jgi:Phage integrase, N-terminal SAM-like domain
VLVQRVEMPVSGRESWTLLGDDGEVVEPAERYLAYLAAIERSPHTVRAYAVSLKLWFEFLGRGASTATASAAASSAVARLIVAATVYRQIASATGNSAPRTGHWASTAAITTVTPNTGLGQTRRSDSTRAVRAATTRLTASGGCAGCAVWAKEKLPERRQAGQQGTPDAEDPGTRRARSRVLDRCPEGRRSIGAAFPGVQASRRRSRQAARPVSTTAYPHRTANPVHGPS